MLVTKEFTFDAAHFLPRYHGQCEDLHGHTYRLQITVEGPVGNEGMVMDFAILKQLVSKKVLERLDHKLINDVIEVASAENMAVWIWQQLSASSAFPTGVNLQEVKLWETPRSFVTYHGN